jgi:hypothetical protein
MLKSEIAALVSSLLQTRRWNSLRGFHLSFFSPPFVRGAAVAGRQLMM